MKFILEKISQAEKNIYSFLKWLVISSITGIFGGVIGSIFCLSVNYVTNIRENNSNIIYLIPLSGIIIIKLYKIFGNEVDLNTNLIIDRIRTDGKVPLLMAPLIFISTVITHLFGGSAGREGAALQLGGSIGSNIGRIINLDKADMHTITLCGMSAVFSSLFGTPLTAVFFAMEVISVGILYYSNFIPCIISAIVAYIVSRYFGIGSVSYTINCILDISVYNVFKVILIGLSCALLSIVFCEMLHKTAHYINIIIKNDYYRIIVGGLIILIGTIIVGNNDYNGAGMDIIQKAINGEAKNEAFILKMLFTVVTICFGYKGGEIVPTFFIGATFGCVVAKLIGIDPSIGAAIGIVALFCGVTNTLITSIVMSVELFGSGNLVFFAIACGVSYTLSGYYSLYSSQKIMYSKLKGNFININAK